MCSSFWGGMAPLSLMRAEETLHWIDLCTQKARIRGGCVDSATPVWGHRAGEAGL